MLPTTPSVLGSAPIFFGAGIDSTKLSQPTASEMRERLTNTKRQPSFRKNRPPRRSSLMAVSDRFNETVNNFQDKMRSTGSLIKRCVSVHNSKQVESDPKQRLDNLLGKLYFEFNSDEVDALKRAYHCEVCNDTNAPCHQIRAVYDAFNLAWSEEGASKEGLLGLADLGVFVSKCELGKEFLERIRIAMLENLGLGADGKLGAREFLVVFAYALRSLSPEERLLYNRAFGRMLGVEMTKQRFRWNKFFVAALAYNCAPMTDLFCLMERRSPPRALAIGDAARLRRMRSPRPCARTGRVPPSRVAEAAESVPPGGRGGSAEGQEARGGARSAGARDRASEHAGGAAGSGRPAS